MKLTLALLACVALSACSRPPNHITVTLNSGGRGETLEAVKLPSGEWVEVSRYTPPPPPPSPPPASGTNNYATITNRTATNAVDTNDPMPLSITNRFDDGFRVYSGKAEAVRPCEYCALLFHFTDEQWSIITNTFTNVTRENLSIYGRNELAKQHAITNAP